MSWILPGIEAVAHLKVGRARSVLRGEQSPESIEQRRREARSRANKRWYAKKGKEYHRQRQAEYRAWRSSNKEHLREYHRAWRAKNKESRKLYYRMHYAKNREERRAYLNERQRIYRARKNESPSAITKRGVVENISGIRSAIPQQAKGRLDGQSGERRGGQGGRFGHSLQARQEDRPLSRAA